MPDVEIQYSLPCGHLDRAIDTQRHLPTEFGQRLDGIRLKTGEGGVFTVAVDGEKIFDKNNSAYDLEAITAGVASRIQN